MNEKLSYALSCRPFPLSLLVPCGIKYLKVFPVHLIGHNSREAAIRRHLRLSAYLKIALKHSFCFCIVELYQALHSSFSIFSSQGTLLVVEVVEGCLKNRKTGRNFSDYYKLSGSQRTSPNIDSIGFVKRK